MSIVNIAGYQFTDLTSVDKERLKCELSHQCRALNLKGTILLANEGTNQVLAGSRESIQGYYDYLKANHLFPGIEFKESISDTVPFQRLLVKLKKEIIPFGLKQESTAPYVTPSTLKAWLDEGKEVVLLDTRNPYEVAYGTFENAKTLENLNHFRDFPEAVNELEENYKEKIIVTFCTGGIRCEKAAPLMKQKGFKEVYQLEGGILKYFEMCGNVHYEGNCFVFDERVALQPNLKPQSAVLSGNS